ncbi:hypothetical protein [Actinomadura opuntiae]|uniref:hypothetical protein n=1 Tax=Actinomadura sp. OS1-43 TaxID=604315 RepID=UPI00255B0342|nr:hypothetical protein [Actinomadura sp. OS1-43]
MPVGYASPKHAHSLEAGAREFQAAREIVTDSMRQPDLRARCQKGCLHRVGPSGRVMRRRTVVRLENHMRVRRRRAEKPSGAGGRDVAFGASAEGVLRQERHVQMAQFSGTADARRPESADHEPIEFGSIIAVFISRE